MMLLYQQHKAGFRRHDTENTGQPAHTAAAAASRQSRVPAKPPLCSVNDFDE